jgi:hypothetical protein
MNLKEIRSGINCQGLLSAVVFCNVKACELARRYRRFEETNIIFAVKAPNPDKLLSLRLL